MSLKDMISIMSEAHDCFPSIRNIVFTGGECTLLLNDIRSAIQQAKSFGFATRVVSNGFWAKDVATAKNILQSLMDSGLDEINFSTGDEHARFVSAETIANAISVSARFDRIKNIAVNVETTCHSIISPKFLNELPPILALSEEERKKILYIRSPWVEFRSHVSSPNSKVRESGHGVLNNKIGCLSVLDSLNINPAGQMLSCCGLCSEYSPFLKLGSVSKMGLKRLHNLRFEDLIKLWLYVDGPYSILCQIGKPPKDDGKHQCEYCFNLLHDKENLELLMNIEQKKVEQILLNYNIKVSRYEKRP